MRTGCVAPPVRWPRWPWSLRKRTSGRLRCGRERQDIARCCPLPLGQGGPPVLWSALGKAGGGQAGGILQGLGKGAGTPVSHHLSLPTQEKEIINLQGALIGISESCFPYDLIPVVLRSKLTLKVHVVELTAETWSAEAHTEICAALKQPLPPGALTLCLLGSSLHLKPLPLGVECGRHGWRGREEYRSYGGTEPQSGEGDSSKPHGVL